MKSRRQIKTFFFVLLLEAFCAVSVYGQSNIHVTEDLKQRRQVSLNGKVEVVFVSQENNLFIETSRPSLDEKKTPVKNAEGKWEYVLVLQLQSTEGTVNGRTFTITQSGTTDMATYSKKTFVADNRYYFIVETIKNPIFLVDKTAATDGHFVNGEASIEIMSLVKVSVTTHPDLPCRIETYRAEAGYYSTTIIVDMTKYESKSNEIHRQQLVYEDMNGTLLERAENGETVSDNEWNTLETMERQLEQAYSYFSAISTIKVTSYESNEIVINIEDLKAKQKKVYSVESTNKDQNDGGLSFTVNDVNFKMIAVEGETFSMGATKEQKPWALWDEEPVRTVTLDDYYIGETEVSQTLWVAVMGTNPSKYKGGDLPVENVSYEQALTFISLLNQKTGEEFRLPTEAEWEFAARGGKESKGFIYSGSNAPDEVAHFEKSGETVPPMTKKANELGIYDMSGNVWEWCSDWYGEYDKGSYNSPDGPTNGDFRVNRGGCVSSAKQSCRVSARHYNHPQDKYMLGVRLVLKPKKDKKFN